jgi:ATP-dependent RNA helicase DeaD
MTPKLFPELGLSPEMLKAITKLGFEQAAPIQAEAIPLLMAGRDVVGQSQTGSGKTAAFGIPAVEKVDATSRATQILILCPTRELAVQVSEEIHKLAFFKRGLHALPVYGGQSYDRQLFGLRQGAHIVIGTPGRVMDHMRRGTLRFDALKMVILDEVDVMLNMGFRDDIETILQATPKERQTVFFSATIPRPIQQLIERYSRDPQQVRIEQKAMTVPTVEQCYYEVDRRYKIELLARLIDLHDFKLGIVFCNTKRMVDDLVDALNAQGYSADRLHGDMTQAQRDRVMMKFRKSGLEFLVATDVAARGIDVDDVEVVFNYDLPYDGEDYVHRIGRTGRKGRSGRAISFASGREVFQIRNIERYTNMRIQRGKPPTVDEVHEARTNVFLDKLRVTLKSGEYKKQDALIERLLEEGFASTDIASALLHQLQQGEAETAAPPPVRERPSFSQTRPERSDDRPGFNDGPRYDERPRYEDRPRPGRPGHGDAREDRRPASPARGMRPLERPVIPGPVKRPPSVPAKHIAPPSAPTAVAPVASPVIPTDVAPTVHPEVSAAAPATPPVAPPVPVVTEKVKPIAVVPPVAEKVKSLTAVKPVVAAVQPGVAAPPVVGEAQPVAAVKPVISDAPPFVKVPRALRPERPNKKEPWLAAKPRVSRATPSDQTRLWMNLGAEMQVTPIDVVNAVAGETGLPGKVVGTVDVRERHLFVDVAAEHANAIIAKLNRSEIKGRKVKVKLA